MIVQLDGCKRQHILEIVVYLPLRDFETALPQTVASVIVGQEINVIESHHPLTEEVDITQVGCIAMGEDDQGSRLLGF